MTGGVGLGTRVLPVAWRRRAFWGIGIRWFPLVLGRHCKLLDVNRGWPRLGFPVGSVSGVFLLGFPCLGCHLVASWVEFLS